MRRIRSIFVLSLIFIIAGIALTLENLGIVSGASKLWPGFLVLLGTGFLILFAGHGKKDPVLLFLGTVILILGMFFFYFNYTSWTRMATMWPFFLAIAGAGFFSVYCNRRQRLFIFLGASLFLLAGVFYLVFGISLQLWPLSLVAFGFSLFLVNKYYLQ